MKTIKIKSQESRKHSEKKKFKDSKFGKWLIKEAADTKLLFRSIPGLVLTLFILATFVMNLLASVALVQESWIALDAGILVSFIGFLLSDMIVKRFGAKAAIKVTILSFVVNIGIAVILTVVAAIANGTGAPFALIDYATLPQWWIIGASSIAFLASGIIDSLLHVAIRKMFKKNPDGLAAHIASAWGSTFVGQFLDNLIFGFLFTYLASHVGLWGMEPMTVLALFMLALTGAVAELLFQAIFTPIGFRIADKWGKEKVGQEYLDAQSKSTSSVA